MINEEEDEDFYYQQELPRPKAEDLMTIQKNTFQNNFAKKTMEEMNRINNNYHKQKPLITNINNIYQPISNNNNNFNNQTFSYFDGANLGYNLGKVWCEKDAELNEKLYNSGKEVKESIEGMSKEVKMGSVVGAFFGPGIGGEIEADEGGIFSVLESHSEGKISEVANDSSSKQIKNGIDYYAGILGFNLSGGVEFVFPEEIPEFKEKFSFDKIHYFAFEFEDEENNFDINEIINLINSKFLNNIKITNLNELFETILMEIAQGFLYKKNLPMISLNFNKEGLLYSIMNDCYKNTITGNILTFLDYYLKSYVNGGFFKEEFIFFWQNEKNIDRNFLQKNIIDFKKYLFEINHNPNDINYISMFDLNDNTNFDNNYISAFRIIGNIKNNLKFYKNLFFPNCYYFTQYDFNILPEWQSKIEIDSSEKNSAEKINKNHKIMKTRVTFLMKKIPFLKPYFEVLKLITFAIHYLPNVQKIGMFPIFTNAVQNKKIGEKYCKSIPKIFPPLPIRKRVNVEVVIKIKEIVEIFRENNYEKLNQFISVCFYEAELKIENAIEKQKFLLNKIKNFVREKVKKNIENDDKYVINFFSDKNLKIFEIEQEFIKNLFFFPKFDLIEDYFTLFDLLNEQENSLFKPKKNKDFFLNLKSFSDLKKEIEEIVNLFAIFKFDLIEKKEQNKIKETNEINNLFEETKKKQFKIIQEQFIIAIKENFQNISQQDLNNKLNSPEIQNLIKIEENKIILELNKKKQEFFEEKEKKFQKILDLEIIIDNLNSSLEKLQNKLIFYNLINENLVQKISDNQKFILTLNYTKPNFHINENEEFFPIRGGCLPKINNKIFLTENEEFNEKIYESFTNSNFQFKINNKKYFVMKTELRNGFIFGELLNHFSKTFDKNKIIFLASLISHEKINFPSKKKDFSGNSIANYKLIINEIIPTKEELNTKNNFNETPELFSITLNNPNLIKKLLFLPYSNFAAKTEGNLTPFALSLINASQSITNLLLKNISKIGDLNCSNELGLTYLHLAVMNDNDFAVKTLLDNGADVSKKNRNEANSPIHLMAIFSRNEIIQSVFNYPQFKNNVNLCRPDGKNALHFMSANSILGTKLFLRAGADFRSFDTFGNTQAKYAFFSGRFDCFDLLVEKSKNKHDLFLKQNVLNIILNSENANYDFSYEKINFEFLLFLFEKNDCKNAFALMKILKKKNVFLTENEIYELIEFSCKINSIELLKIVSFYTSLKRFCIGPFIGKFGLVFWVKEALNLGIEIFAREKKILNNKNIFHFCLLNDDKKLLKEIFKITNKITKEFEYEISKLFCKAVIKGKINIICQIEKELKNSKFSKMKISLETLLKNKNTTLNKLKLILNNFQNVDVKSLKIEDAIKFSRPNIVEFLIKLKSVKKNDLNKFKFIAIENNRFDILFTLIKIFPEISENEINFNEIDSKLIEIEEILQENKNNFGLENLLKNKLNKILENFNVGQIKLPICNSYLPHFIIKSKNLFLFECLKKNYYKNIFFVDDNLNSCFDFLEPNQTIEKVSFDDLKIVIKFFENDFFNVLNVIEIFVENVKNLNYQIDDEFIQFLFDFLPKKIFVCLNKNNNSIFHIISNLKINSDSIKIVIKKLFSLKQENLKNFKFILNSQNFKGNTFLMNFLENENYEISIEIINNFHENINYKLCNFYGNSILHIIFLNKNFNEIQNNFIIFEQIYQILLKILAKNKELILLQNREKTIPFILASNSGCNIGMKLILEFYPPEFLENLSENTTALHQACLNNNINTVRFLLEQIHYDPNIKLKKNGKKIKLPENSTPLHAAAFASSSEIFKYLLFHGADPFLRNVEGNDAFDVGFKYGKFEFLKFIFNLKSSKIYSSNDKYLLSLVQNNNFDAQKIFFEYLKINTFENFNIVDAQMNSLLILACRAENTEIISFLISVGIDPLIKNKFGFNCLHICAFGNFYCSAGIVLANLDSEKIKKILISKDNFGETPLHVAIKKNYENLSLLFIAFLIRNEIKIEMVKNKEGLNPVQFAIKTRNFKIVLMFIKYLKLNIENILNLNNFNISKEFDDFIFSFDSGLLKEMEIFVEKKIENIHFFKKQNEKIPKKIRENLKKFQILKNVNYNEFNEKIKLKSFEYVYYILSKNYKSDFFTQELFFTHKKILGNVYVIKTLNKLAQNKKEYLIEFFLQILFQLNENCKKFQIENNKNKSDLYKIIEILSVLALPFLNIENFGLILEFMQDLIAIVKIREINENNNFFKFIKICLISFFDCNYFKPKIKDFLFELDKLKNLILFDQDFINNFNFKFSCFLNHEFLFKLNVILNHVKTKDLILLQIQNLNSIPCLFNDEIENLLKKNHFLHEFLIFQNPLFDFFKKINSKNNKKIEVLKDVLEITKIVVDCYELNENEKRIIMKNINYFYDKFFDNNNNNENIFSFFNNFFLISKKIILIKGINFYSSILFETKENIFNFNEIIPYLYIYSSSKEINFPDLNEKVSEILPKIQLNDEEKENLKKIANLIPEFCEIYKYYTDFKTIGKKLGKEFKSNPNNENLSKLISIIAIGVCASLNECPYLIQCLSVSLFLLQNRKSEFKGKLAQIKTGEGKSLIIAMLALANALTGNFVDVITSTHYLAERDQKKFKNFYLQFGISSSNIIKNVPSKSDYDGIIIYGTNTDFEFSLLREGIYNQNKIFTTLDSKLVKRTFDVAIVDECDNLFLDTARNSARIAHPSKSCLNWLYPIVFKYFSENEHELDTNELRKIIYENGKFELNKISEEKLQSLLKSAAIAKQKKLNLDYVIGFENSKRIVQIVSRDTGRIQHGSRWTNGVHEFVEVKEGIEPESESNVIGSISHPTFFENYKILFGLTGTIGDEIERNEIKEIYKLNCYEIPRNFRENLIKEKMEIYENKKEKFNRILNLIQENYNKNNKSQPILVILENIEETIEFGDLLKKLHFDFFTLNDVQKESEDFILKSMGQAKSILVATNAAGRGTDIKIDENSKRNGGLFVIVGFFPRNSRIQFQAEGRAARQGNPGKAKIVVSRDEEFIYFNYFFAKNLNFEDEIQNLLLFRKFNVEDVSKMRIQFVKKERIFFSNLKKFFLFKEFIIVLFENSLFQCYYEFFSDNFDDSKNFGYYKNFSLNQIDDIWAEFYSDFEKERNNNTNFNTKKNYFADFLNKLQNDWHESLREIYGEKCIKIAEFDLVYIVIKNVKNKIVKTNFAHNYNDDYNNFYNILVNLKLSDILN